MRRVSISWKTAQALLNADSTPPRPNDVTRAVDALRAAMKPKRSTCLAATRRVAKKQTKKDETAAIREAVVKRAKGCCEQCGLLGTDLDHFFGRVRVKQSERNCWLLCRACHRDKTDGRSGALWWLEQFIWHAEAHGYASEARRAQNRLESLSLSQQSAAR